MTHPHYITMVTYAQTLHFTNKFAPQTKSYRMPQVERGSSAVEFRTLEWDSLGSNPFAVFRSFQDISVLSTHASSLSCINEYQTAWWKCDWSLRAVITAWLNASQESRVGVGINRSVGGWSVSALSHMLWAVQMTGYCTKYKNITLNLHYNLP